MPSGKLSDFARLIGQSQPAPPSESPVDELIKQVMAPYVVPAAHPDQAAMIAAVDEALSATMRRILHHPDLQALEALWRSVDLLTRELETSSQLQIILYDITAEEIAADLSSTDALESSGLYQLIVNNPITDERLGPPSVLVGNFIFDQTPPHAELLGRISKVAAAGAAPFIAGISTDCLVERDPSEVHPLITESWSMLRQMPQANYIGLTLPRFMLRWPYGASTEPIESFAFEEFTPQAGLRGMLWANGSILAGLLLGKTFSEQGLARMKLGSQMTLGDVPFYYYTDPDGDQIALPSTERMVSEPTAVRIMSQNFMPVLSIRGRSEVRLGSFNSLSGALLAGPWAPLDIKPDEGQLPSANASSTPTDDSTSIEESEARAAAEAEQELDALLADDSPVLASADAELDAALASVAENANDTPPTENEMDTSLADLLSKL
jgi:type VI secretion system protein ImpC